MNKFSSKNGSVVKVSGDKMTLSLSYQEWVKVGEKGGWIKEGVWIPPVFMPGGSSRPHHSSPEEREENFRDLVNRYNKPQPPKPPAPPDKRIGMQALCGDGSRGIVTKIESPDGDRAHMMVYLTDREIGQYGDTMQKLPDASVKLRNVKNFVQPPQQSFDQRKQKSPPSSAERANKP